MSSMRGLPAWTAVLLAVAVTLTGVAIDSVGGDLGAGFTVGFFLGCVFAVLAVARRSVFVAAIQPPIIMAALVPLAYVVTGIGSGADLFSRTQIISIALPLATRFPLMVTTTAIVIAIALVRAFVLEPKRTPVYARPSPGTRRGAPAHARR